MDTVIKFPTWFENVKRIIDRIDVDRDDISKRRIEVAGGDTEIYTEKSQSSHNNSHNFSKL